jgi:hypothetical protein
LAAQFGVELLKPHNRIAHFGEQPGKGRQLGGQELVGDIHPLLAKPPLDGHVDEKSGLFIAGRVLDQDARLEIRGSHVLGKGEQAGVLPGFQPIAGKNKSPTCTPLLAKSLLTS